MPVCTQPAHSAERRATVNDLDWFMLGYLVGAVLGVSFMAFAAWMEDR